MSGLPLARGVDAIPYVTTTAERGFRFPNPAVNQRVQNGETGRLERWNGAAWVDDTLWSDASGVINVKDPQFGAVGDGVTDDTAAFTAAQVAAAAVKGTVLIPGVAAGFRIVTPIAALSNVTWLAEGGATVYPEGGAFIQTTAAVSDFAVRGVTIDGVNGSSSTHGLLIDDAGCDRISIVGNTFRNIGSRAVKMIGATNFRVSGNNVRDCTRGIHVINSQHGFVTENRVHDIGPGIADGQIGILVWANAGDSGLALVESVIVANNEVYDISDNGIRVIAQEYQNDGSVAGSVRHVTVIGNVVQRTGIDCYRMQGDDITITGNVATDPTGGGIRGNGGKRWVVSGNVVTAPTSTPGSPGISLSLSFSGSEGEDAVITGNSVDGASYTGGISLLGNSSSTPSATVTTGARASIASNSVRNVSNFGITVFRWDGVSVNGNIVDGSAEGISVSTSADCNITNNRVMNCVTGSGRGIRTSTATRATIANNVLRGNTQDYDLDAADTTVIQEGVGANVGDADATLTWGTSEYLQRWSSPITADRAVTLSTTGATNGAKFHIVRTAGATGAFNLNVGSGPLKALAAGQWCEVTYSGTAWFVTAFGSL